MTSNLQTALLMAAALSVSACGGGGGNDNDAPIRVNFPPVIDALADQSIAANSQSDTIGFTVSDDLTASDSLTVTAESSAPDVVNADSIVIAGSGASRTLQFTPEPDTAGSAEVTLTVTDAAGLQDRSVFTVTVTPIETSLRMFARDAFADDAFAVPRAIGHLDLQDDAVDDDFADLL